MSTILVVDDMAIIRDPIAASLRLAGHSTICAANGREALDMLKSKHVDLILLDMTMPVMDGPGFLRARMTDLSIAAIPVILLTAVSDRKAVVEVASMGVRDYLLKSMFSMKDLLERVKKLLETSPDVIQATRIAGYSDIAAGSSAAGIGTAPPLINATKEAQPAPQIQSQCAARSNSSVATAPASDAPKDAFSRLAEHDKIPHLLTRDQSIARAQEAIKARTLCGVVSQVISLCANPRSDLTSLVGVLAQDTILAARVLQAANSAAYASGQVVVSDLQEAVRKVGFATIRNIALTVGVYDVMPVAAADGFNPIRCWQHSFAVARTCEALTAANPERSGLAYLVGLCHDLGEIVLHTHFGPEYARLIEVQKATGRSRAELERRMLGIGHEELVGVILRCVALPDAVRGPIEQFHSVNAFSSLPGKSLAGILYLAEWYANSLLLASSEHMSVNLISRSDCRRMTGDDEPAFPEPVGLRNQVLALTTMHSHLSRMEEQELLKPILSRSTQRIWIMRDELICERSPITTALSSLASTVMRTRMPSAAEREQIDALVALTRGHVPATTAQGIAQALSESSRLGVCTLWLATPTAGIDSRMTACPVSLKVLADFLAESAVAKAAA